MRIFAEENIPHMSNTNSFETPGACDVAESELGTNSYPIRTPLSLEFVIASSLLFFIAVNKLVSLTEVYGQAPGAP